MNLNPIQVRVLGVLLERCLANPGAYPMTLNAITVSSNQKSNRDPVVEYEEGEVAKALHDLSLLDLVSQAAPAIGARVNRFRHEAEKRLGWGRRVQAVLAELLLRGPQTVGELKGRIGRMNVELDIQGVQHLIDELMGQEPAWVQIVPRISGQSAVRYGHTLLDSAEPTGLERDSSAAAGGSTELNPDHAIQRMDHLEQRLNDISIRLEEISNRLDRLERR